MALEKYVKFLRGTPTAFGNLTTKSEDTLYFVSEPGSTTGLLYLGSKLIGGGAELGSLADVNLADAVNGDILTYDATTQQWVAKDLESLLAQIPEISVTQIYEINLAEGQSHMEAIATAVAGKSLNSGDIAIVKELIHGDRYQHTAYVYNGAKWVAMDGNYNAENVYFDEDLITTAKVGNIQTLTNGQATISSKGKNLKEVWQQIFVKEANPSKPTPTVSVTLNEAGEYEVGTTVTPTYKATYNSGTYAYGPSPTGSTLTEWIITDNAESAAQSTATGSFAQITVDDDTEYKVTAKGTYSDGEIPVTNLGNPYEASKIVGGTKSATSKAITGYRNTFYGAVEEKNTITSLGVRGLAGVSNTGLANGSQFTIDIPVGAVRVIFAYPAGLQDVSSVLDSNGLNAEIKTAFTKSILSVEGANSLDPIEYKVYVTDYAEPNDTANSYKVTI